MYFPSGTKKTKPPARKSVGGFCGKYWIFPNVSRMIKEKMGKWSYAA
jgi:hypothetical protein